MAEALRAQDLAKEGTAAYRSARFAEAAALFSQAAHAYASSGQALDCAEANNNASVAYLQAGDAVAALKSAEGSDQVFADAKDQRRQGMALGNQAAALEALNRLDEALNLYNQSAQLLKASGETEMRASVLKSISALQIRTGNQLQALASMDAALQNQKRLSLRERILQKLLRIPIDMLNRR